MKTNNLFAEYVAPEVEVISMVVEKGFEISMVNTIEDAKWVNYEEEF